MGKLRQHFWIDQVKCLNGLVFQHTKYSSVNQQKKQQQQKNKSSSSNRAKVLSQTILKSQKSVMHDYISTQTQTHLTHLHF